MAFCARCAECGKELLVAFSCKRRGVCPSCNARRMCATAAHLSDCVLPEVPLRQWVLSVPFELRLLLAKRADALSAVGRIFVQEILRWQRAQARLSDPRLASLPATELRGGAICFPQRFGGSLNLNVHYHVAVPDGVFVRDADRCVRFHQLSLPNPGDLHDIGYAVELRVLRWLKRRGLLHGTTEPVADQPEPPTALDACLQSSLGIGELVALPGHDPANEAAAAEPIAPLGAARQSKSRRGFDIHASVGVSGRGSSLMGAVGAAGDGGASAATDARLGGVGAGAAGSQGAKRAAGRTSVCTCSTIAGVVEAVPVPDGVLVMRIDRPMAEHAIASKRRIVVCAALRSSFEPTVALLRQVASNANRAIELVEVFCDRAWPFFERGDHPVYFSEIALAIEQSARPTDSILLAQASMARAAELVGHLGIPVLSSPRLGVEVAMSMYRSSAPPR